MARLRGSSWGGVELSPQLLDLLINVAASEAREALCLALNVSRQLGKIGSFTMFQWLALAAERATMSWGTSSSLGINTCFCLGAQ